MSLRHSLPPLGRRKFLLFIVCRLALVYPAAAQSPVASPNLQSFEVATIRPTPPANHGDGVWSQPGIGKFSAQSVSLEFLIGMAFNVNSNQIADKPAWLDTDRFDVVAKPEAGIALSRDQLRPMLQELLKERFHLLSHRETRPTHGYALVIANKGPHLTPSRGDHPPGHRIYTGPGRLEGLNWSMPFLASMLQPAAGLPVVDRTGIAGSFDIKLEFAPDMESESTLPSLFTSIEETLGLKLESGKVPVEMLVIDHADRIPMEN